MRIGTYGNYSSDNYGANAIYVDVGGYTFYFSYQTCVAFSTPEEGLVCSENIWSTTTGKHLNWIQEDKRKRIPNDEFERRLRALESSLSALGGIPIVR